MTDPLSSGALDTATATGLATAVAEQPLPVMNGRRGAVVVTGAAGFVGSHLCQALAADGWSIRAIVRDPVRSAARLAHLPVELRIGDIRDASFMRDAVSGARAVVHLAAIAIQRRGDSYQSANTEATRIVAGAARETGVTRFIHMSQNGSDSRSPYAFLRSKGEAQDLVAASDLRWTILRPSVIFGPEDEFVNVLARLVRLSPLAFPLPDGGRARFQPIWVGDVAQTIVRSLHDDRTVRGTYALGGPAPLSLRDMAERILTAMHTRRAIVGIPATMLRPLVAVLQRVLPHPPVTAELLDLLAVDNTVPDNALTSVFGITPVPFAPEELVYLRRITARGALASLFGGRS